MEVVEGGGGGNVGRGMRGFEGGGGGGLEYEMNLPNALLMK